MSEEWKETVRGVVVCFCIALVVLALATLYKSAGAERARNVTLSADLDTYKRASAEYARRESELKRSVATAQERASRAESAARNAQAEFARYQRGVVGRDSAVRERVEACIRSLDDLGDGIDRSIKLVDLCIELDAVLEPGTR